MSIKVTSPKNSKSLSVTSVEEIDEQVEIVEELPSADPGLKMVRVAINREVDPAPRVGNIDMVTRFGHSKLIPGIMEVPEAVAQVLIDKGIAQRV
jgi:hypothetical protein